MKGDREGEQVLLCVCVDVCVVLLTLGRITLVFVLPHEQVSPA